MPRLLRRDFAGVAKKEIKNNPLIGKTLELAGTVFVDRENSASAIDAIQPLVDAMRNEGKSVIIAPEGTRTVSPRLGPFKKGAFHLAMQAGVPMVPVVIHNAGDVAPKGEFVMRPATVEVDVLPPVDTSGWRPETIEEHVAEVRRMFQVMLGQDDEGGFVPKARPRMRGPRQRKAVPVKTSKPKSAGAEARAGRAAAESEPAAPPMPRKAGSKKAPRKKALRKKVLSKKAPAKKAAPKKVSAKKAAGKKVPAKKAAAKKATRKKAPEKKAAPKKALTKKARRRKPPKKAAATPEASGVPKPRKPPRPKPSRKKVLKKPGEGAGG